MLVALPTVTPARGEGAEADTLFGFQFALVEWGEDSTVPRHSLEHEVPKEMRTLQTGESLLYVL